MATYTSTATGNWSAGATWVGGVKPPSAGGHKIVIAAGHTVTFDEAAGEYGDDTSSTTAANNAIVVNGTLTFSQSMTTELTCKGTLCIAGTGSLTCGSSGSPLSSSYTCTIKLNYSASMAAGKHILFGTGTAPNLALNGAVRTRNTRLTSGTSAGATSITVDASVGWAVGDSLVIASDTDDATRAQVVTISAGSSPTWTVSAITNARSAACRVGNLSSNVIVRAHTAAQPSGFAFGGGTTAATADIGHVRFENIGAGGGWTASSSGFGYGTMVASSSLATPIITQSCAFEGTNSAHYAALDFRAISANWSNGHNDAAVYTIGTTGPGIYSGTAGTGLVTSSIFYRVGIGILANQANSVTLNNAEVWASTALYRSNSQGVANVTVNNSILHGGQLEIGWSDNLEFYGCDLQISGANGPRLYKANSAAIGNWTARTLASYCKYSTNALTGALNNGTPGQQVSHTDIAVWDGAAYDVDDNRIRSVWHTSTTDSGTRNHGKYSVKMQVLSANTAISRTFTIDVLSGVEQTIKGSVQWDAQYASGGLTKPIFALSGQGVSETFTPSGSDAATWHNFTFTYTPTSTGKVTATFTAQSTNTSGYAWFDGVYHYPMIQSVRHYGYQFLEQTALEVDADIVETTEATVLAYGVSVNHGTNTITVTSSATTVQIADYLVADLCQTANQSEAVHYTRNVGGDFTTSYAVVVNTGVTVTGNFTTTGTVTLNGTGTVAGVYTSSGGTNTKLTLTGLSAAAVEIFDELGAHYAYTASVTGTYTLYLPHTETGTWSWKVAKYGYLAAEGTFAAGTGAVTAAPSLSTDTGITQGTVATVIAYTDLLNLDRQYDYLAYWETTSTGIMFDRLAVKNGDSVDFGALNVTFDSTAVAMVTYAAPALTLKAGTVVVGSTFTEFETSGTFTLAGASTYAAPAIWTDSGGRHVYVTAANIVSGSRVQIYNVTNSVEVYNGALGGAGLSYGVVYTADKTFRLRADHADKLPLEVTGTLTRLGVTWLDSQDDDTVYTDNAIDGSTCTEFAADLPNIHIDVSDPDGETSVQRLYAWAQYYQTTSAGIASDFFGSVTAFDSVNYTIDETLADIKLDNIGGSPVRIIGGYLTRSDGSTIIAATSGSIQMDPGKAYLAGASSIADGVLAAEVWTGYSLKRTTRIIAAAVAGKVSGGPGSPVFRNLPDDADQVSGTADANGNRTAATYGA